MNEIDASLGPREGFSRVVPAEWRQAFLSGRKAFCFDDLAGAQPIFDKLERALPGNIEIRLYAAWTRARLGGALSADHLARIVALAREALGLGGALALPLCILAHAALRRHEYSVARRLFRRAADADPALIDARRGVRLLTQLLESRSARR